MIDRIPDLPKRLPDDPIEDAVDVAEEQRSRRPPDREPRQDFCAPDAGEVDEVAAPREPAQADDARGGELPDQDRERQGDGDRHAVEDAEAR